MENSATPSNLFSFPLGIFLVLSNKAENQKLQRKFGVEADP